MTTKEKNIKKPTPDNDQTTMNNEVKAQSNDFDTQNLKLNEQIEVLTQQLQVLQRDVQTYKASHDKLLKLVDMQNQLKIEQQRLRDEEKYIGAKFVNDFIEALDWLEASEKHLANVKIDPQIQSFIDGYRMIHGKILKSLAQYGFSPITVKLNDPIDGYIHSVIDHIESSKIIPNHVAEVIRTGYKVHNRVIRPASVNAAKTPEQNTEQSNLKNKKEKE